MENEKNYFFCNFFQIVSKVSKLYKFLLFYRKNRIRIYWTISSFYFKNICLGNYKSGNYNYDYAHSFFGKIWLILVYDKSSV